MNRSRRAAQRGLTLVELMVSLGIGAIVMSGALAVCSEQLRSQRRLLLEARMQQDLRAATHLIVQQLRHAGYWSQALTATNPPFPSNPYAAIGLAGGTDAGVVRFAYSDDDGDSDAGDPGGIRLNGRGLQLRQSGGTWQALTDPEVTEVTRFSIVPHNQSISLGSLCAPICTPTQQACPSLSLRSFEILISARAVHDPSLTRDVREWVSVRNDEIPTPVCP